MSLNILKRVDLDWVREKKNEVSFDNSVFYIRSEHKHTNIRCSSIYDIYVRSSFKKVFCNNIRYNPM